MAIVTAITFAAAVEAAQRELAGKPLVGAPVLAAALVVSPARNWREYVVNVRADAIEPGSREVAQFMGDNPGEFATEADAIDAYKADHAFLSPILGHWFRFEDGVETADGWVHIDARTIGLNDPDFAYGSGYGKDVPAAAEEPVFLMAAE